MVKRESMNLISEQCTMGKIIVYGQHGRRFVHMMVLWISVEGHAGDKMN
jgi:hypothetical protein